MPTESEDFSWHVRFIYKDLPETRFGYLNDSSNSSIAYTWFTCPG